MRAPGAAIFVLKLCNCIDDMLLYSMPEKRKSMAVQTFNPTDLPQSTTNWAVAQRIVGPFAPHAQVTPNLTLALDPGHLLSGTTLTEVNAQNAGPFVPPASGFRIDRVVIDRSTGAASIVTGTANSLTPPAIPTGKLPVARVMLQAGTDAITNAIIVDERALFDLTPPLSNTVICRATLGGVDQELPAAVYTKIAFSAVDFNIGNAFDIANKRFLPNVPGYYEVSAQLSSEIPTNNYVGVMLKKGADTIISNALSTVSTSASTLHGFAQVYDIVYMNGTSDFLEVFGRVPTTGRPIVGNGAYSYFCAKRVG